jgi:hypothetical protein
MFIMFIGNKDDPGFCFKPEAPLVERGSGVLGSSRFAIPVDKLELYLGCYKNTHV